jgi:hypothetical protein
MLRSVSSNRRFLHQNGPFMSAKPPTILIVHRDPVAAIEFAYAVSDAGATVLGPYVEAADALLAMIGVDVDCALIDCNRRDARVPVLVDQLDAGAVPVVIAVTADTMEDAALRFPFATIAGGADRRRMADLLDAREPEGPRAFRGWTSGERHAVRDAVHGLVAS